MLSYHLRILLLLAATITFPVPNSEILQAQAEKSTPSTKRPFIWKVQAPQAAVYLLGSIHVARSSIYPLDEKIEKAFDRSDTLVVEVNTADISPGTLVMEMTAKATYPDQDSLERHVSREVLDLTNSQLAKYGVSIADFKKFKPWFIATTIEAMELSKLGISANNGIDQHFLNRAKEKKRILELESASEQLQLLDSFSDKEQEAFLKYTLKDLQNTGKHMDEMVAAWLAGDEQKLDALLTEAIKEDRHLSGIYKKLIDDRNRKMAVKIEKYLSGGDGHSYFVVVGAGHLVGENGLLRILRRRYEIKQL